MGWTLKRAWPSSNARWPAAREGRSTRSRISICRLVIALAAGLLLLGRGAVPAQAQTAPATAAGPADTTAAAQQPLVTAVHFEGNQVFSREVLARRVRTAPNRRMLGVPGFTWWRWLYGLGDFIGGRPGGALKRLGEPPATLDRATLAGDVDRLRAFYRQEGFRNVQVQARAVSTADPGEVAVVFYIQPGPALHARRVRYTGLGALPETQRRRLVKGSLLRPEGARLHRSSTGSRTHRRDTLAGRLLSGRSPLLRRDTLGTPPVANDTIWFQARGRRYSEARLLNERSRLLDVLRNEGYARVARDSIRALVFPRPPDSFDVTFRVRPGERYRLGDLHFHVEGPETEAPLRTDTLHLPGATGQVTVQVEGESELSTDLLKRALRVQPGQWYSQAALLETKRRLGAAGVFSFTDITALAPRRPDSAAAPVLPHRIDLRTRPRHRVQLETFALQRTGFISNEVGFGLGATYENANFFSEGETFRARIAGSVASDFDTDDAQDLFFSSAQLEGSLSLTYPYLIGPFARLESLYGAFYDARTQLSMNLLTARRENLGFIIRGRGEARLRLEMRHSPTLASLVDVADFSLSNPDTLSGFRTTFLERVIGTPDDPVVTDPVQRARILEDYTAPQVNSAIRYTLRASTVNPLVRAEGYSYEAAAEMGGTLPALLDRFVLTPDSVEGSLPGLPFLRGDEANRLRYRPYLRFVGDARRYRPLGSGTVLAGKLIAGWAHPIGRSGVVPFDRRFYAGGASSVRGWALRELRPAAPIDTLMGDVPNLLGGDIKLEAGLELRQTVLEDVIGSTDWIAVLFTDAGNAWIGPQNPGPDALRFRASDFFEQIGVGSGLGLRLSWDFLVLRLDMAFKVHDPLQASNPFPDGLSQPRLHFGIGHAF